jgi:hypothetical protein
MQYNKDWRRRMRPTRDAPSRLATAPTGYGHAWRLHADSYDEVLNVPYADPVAGRARWGGGSGLGRRR